MSGRMLTGTSNMGLGEILRSKRLEVPANQRDYSWTIKEVTTLFQDFAAAIQEREEDYFLGTVVVVEKGSNAYEIVDGQQRLSTTAILLAAIRDYLQSRPDDGKIAQTIQTDYLTASSSNMRDREPRIRMNLADNEYFARLLQGVPRGEEKRHSHQLLKESFEEAQKQVRKIVAPHDEKRHGDVLVDWISFIERKAQVVLITISSEGNAYRMFETLNDRGLKTTQADLVKNYLFGRAGSRILEAQDKWAGLRSLLESLDDEKVPTVHFLRHGLMLRRGYFRENVLHDQIQKEARSPAEVVSLLDELESMAAMYVALFNPRSDQWVGYPHSHSDAIRALDLFGIAGLRPLMLAVALKFESGEAAKAFKAFVGWSVRFVVAGSTLTGGYLEVPLATAASKVMKEELGDFNAIRKELLPRIPTDEDFHRAFSSATVSKAALARYYLRCLEQAASNQSNPEFVPNEDAESVNLEHVLPERPMGNWPQFSDDDSKLYSKRIGNLALMQTRRNSEMKSSSFEDKREVLSGSPFVLTAQIGAEEGWTRDRIIQRQNLLADLAVKTWKA